MKLASLALLLPLMSQAASYSAKTATVDGVEVVLLTDEAHKTEVTVIPSLGNMAYRMMVNGKNAFYNPVPNLGQLKLKPSMGGIPFLWPWANRIDQDAFYANGKKYAFNLELGNLRRDGNKQPIHGLITYSPLWKVTAMKADGKSAWVTSRLEYWKHPDLMAQFPFAHTIDITYRLSSGALEVETAVQNHSSEPMPVLGGYHPYYQVTDSPREEWTIRIPAREKMTLSPKLVPTGEKTAVASADPFPLKDLRFDDVFVGLIPSANGRAEFFIQGKKEKVTVGYGPKFNTGVIYTNPGRNYVCFEPMAGITNAINLAHQGVYKDLQTIPAGGLWRESFWVSTSGF
jgi:aldose 1-epimerase